MSEQTREEWTADAERCARIIFYESNDSRVKNVSKEIADYCDPPDYKPTLIYRLKEIRLEITRMLKALETGKADMNDVCGLLWHMQQRYVTWAQAAEDRRQVADKAAEEAYVQKEIARRQTDEAWDKELEGRAHIKRWLADPKARFETT